MGVETDVVSVARAASRSLDPHELEGRREGFSRSLVTALAGGEGASRSSSAYAGSVLTDVPRLSLAEVGVPNLTDDTEEELVTAPARRVRLVAQTVQRTDHAVNRTL